MKTPQKNADLVWHLAFYSLPISWNADAMTSATEACDHHETTLRMKSNDKDGKLERQNEPKR